MTEAITGQAVLIRSRSKQEPRIDDVRANSQRVWAKRGSILTIPVSECYSYLAHPSEWELVTEKQLANEKKAEFQAAGGIESIRAVLPLMSAESLLAVIDMIEEEIDSRNVSPEGKPERDTGGLNISKESLTGLGEIIPAAPMDVPPAPAPTEIVETKPFAEPATGTKVEPLPIPEPQPVNTEAPAEQPPPQPTGDASVDASSASAYAAKMQQLKGIVKEMDAQDPEQFTAGGKPRVAYVKEKYGVDATSAELDEALNLLAGKQ